MKTFTTQEVAAIVLAAGKGTRMGNPDLPKVLNLIAGKPLIEHVLSVLKKTAIQKICLVLQENLEPFQDLFLKHKELTVCSQIQRNGTAGAAAVGGLAFSSVKLPEYTSGRFQHGPKLDSPWLLILAGDTPFLDPESLSHFMNQCHDQNDDIAICAMTPEKPFGYGRLIFDHQKRLCSIREQKDLHAKEQELSVCHSGVLFAKTAIFFELLRKVTNQNSQKEFYLTDLVSLAYDQGLQVGYVLAQHSDRFLGVNTKEELDILSQKMKRVMLPCVELSDI